MRLGSVSRLCFNRALAAVFALSFVLGGVVMVSDPASAISYGDFEYQPINGDTEVEITLYIGAGGNVTIPDMINGRAVTSIGEWAFSDIVSLITVTIPDSVTTIGFAAFRSCVNLTSVFISPHSALTTIDHLAFQYCDSIVSFSITSNISTVGMFAFSYCSSLTSISVDSSNPYFFSYEGVLYNQTTLIQCPNGLVGSITIPYGITSIGDYSFQRCKYLTSLNIPNGVTNIGSWVFAECDSLNTLTIPSSVTYIGESPIILCSALTSIDVDDDNPIYSSVDGVLFNKVEKTLIRYPEGKIGNYQIADNVNIIAAFAFSGCDSLTTVNLSSSVTTIGGAAFSGCSALTSINFFGLSAPNEVGLNWIEGCNQNIQGHAYSNSDFPAPAINFFGLMMCDYIPRIPGPPTGLTALAAGPNIVLNWFAPLDDGGANIDYYIVYQNEVALADNPTGVTTVITGLKHNHSYSFSVASHNLVGIGNRSNLVTIITNTIPDAPTGLTAIAGNGQITLSWNEPSFNGGAPIDYYVIYQDNVPLSEITSNQSILISGLKNGQVYSFSVAAHSAVGIGKVSEAIFANLPVTSPTAPLNVTGYAIDSGIVIVWSEPSNDGGADLTSYSIYRTDNDGTIIFLISVNSTVLKYSDNSVVPGHSYVYFVQAINEVGASDYSDGSSPIIAFSLIRLYVGCDSTVSELGIVNILTGQINLVSSDDPVAGLEIYLAYSVNNGIDWVALPTVVSSSDGSFSRSWIPTAEGVYLVKATWVGNDQYPSTESVFSIAITISTQNEIFTVQSNSTISNLIFNSETKQLSFTVSGESGTLGYTRIVVSKELVANGSDIILTMDGADMNYELSSTETSWVLYFTYTHSSHNVVADLNSESGSIIPVNDDMILMFGAGLVAFLVVIMLTFVLYRRKGKQ